MIKKIIKRFFGILFLLIFIILLSLGVYAWLSFDSFFRTTLKTAFNTATKGKYKIDFKDYTLGFQDGYLLFDSLYIRSGDKKNKRNNDRELLNIFIQELNFTNINWTDIYNTKTLEIGYIEFVNPDIEIEMSGSPDKTNRKPGKSKTVRFLKQVIIKEIKFRKGRIDMNLKKTGIQANCSGIQTLVSGVNLDLKKGIKTYRVFDDFKFQLDSLFIDLQKAEHKLTISTCAYSYSDSSFTCQDLLFRPVSDKMQFHQNLTWQKDWTSFYSEFTTIKGFNPFSPGDSQTLHINSMVMDEFELDIYKDKRVPRKWKKKKMPQELIRQVGIPFFVDTINCRNGFIVYEEFPEDGVKSGQIHITDTEIQIYNVTNQKKYDLITAQFNGRLNGRGFIDVNFNIPVWDKQMQHSFSGSLSAMYMNSLNNFLENTEYIKINRGRIRKATFNVWANQSHASGELTVQYDNLNISLLRHPMDKKKSDQKKTLSFLANTIIKKDNPSGNRPVRSGEISYSRDYSRSFVNFWLKSILSGVKENMTPEKLNTKPKSTFEKIKEKFRFGRKKNK
jgi:hypothetical protein